MILRGMLKNVQAQRTTACAANEFCEPATSAEQLQEDTASKVTTTLDGAPVHASKVPVDVRASCRYRRGFPRPLRAWRMLSGSRSQTPLPMNPFSTISAK